MNTKTTLLGIACYKVTVPPILSLALCALLSLPLGEGWGGASFAQNIGINSTGATPDASALLDINANPGNNKGLLIPRVALTVTTSNAPIGVGIALSLMVYNTATVNDVTPGYYYWSGTAWQRLQNILPVPSNDWTLLGNAGTVDGTHFIGTTDNVPFNIRVNNQNAGRIDPAGPTFLGYQAGNSNTAINNVGFGYQSLFANTSGNFNTANGYRTLWSNSTGQYNTANGSEALYSNSTGGWNTANGSYALYLNTTGNSNTSTGVSAQQNNTIGSSNTANGRDALLFNTAGSQNTAIGYRSLFLQSYNNGGVAWNSDNVAVGFMALYSNNPTATSNGSKNTAVGNFALRANTTGRENSANGYQTLYSNTGGFNNTAMGVYALYSNTTGNQNTAVGQSAIRSNTTGSSNTAFGEEALGFGGSGSNNTSTGMRSMMTATGNYNTANGWYALYSNSGSYNTAHGARALYYNPSGSNNVAIGYFSGGTSGVTVAQCSFLGSNSTLNVSRTNVTLLGYGIVGAQSTANNQVLLGNTAVTQLRAAITGITAYSDARFKTNVNEDIAGLDFILKLKPVTYSVRPLELHKIWGTPDSLVNTMDFSEAKTETRIGFLAQDVEKAAKESGFNFPGIDVPKNDKEVYTLRYVDFIMPMVKAVQELNDSLMLNVESLKLENQKLIKRIEALEKTR